jgi:hypothetical protein
MAATAAQAGSEARSSVTEAQVVPAALVRPAAAVVPEPQEPTGSKPEMTVKTVSRAALAEPEDQAARAAAAAKLSESVAQVPSALAEPVATAGRPVRAE